MPPSRHLTLPHASTRPTASSLRAHLADVTRYRETVDSQGLGNALAAIRHMQVQRFRQTYADLLVDPRHARATHFFLAELYGAQDYSERDAQFARIAGAVERLFPDRVMALAVELAEVHRNVKDFENSTNISVAQKIKIDGDMVQQKHHVLEESYNSLPKQVEKLLSTIACFRSPVELKTLESIAENKVTLD